MRRGSFALLMAPVLLGGALAWAQFGGLFSPDVPTVTVDELVLAAEQGGFTVEGSSGTRPYLIVDVRDEREFAVSMIPGAITKADYESSRSRYAEHRIIPYCTVGYRSGKYTQKLRQAGIDAVNFKGSIMAWVEAGQPLVTPAGAATRRVHTWSRHIAAPPGYEQVID